MASSHSCLDVYEHGAIMRARLRDELRSVTTSTFMLGSTLASRRAISDPGSQAQSGGESD